MRTIRGPPRSARRRRVRIGCACTEAGSPHCRRTGGRRGCKSVPRDPSPGRALHPPGIATALALSCELKGGCASIRRTLEEVIGAQLDRHRETIVEMLPWAPSPEVSVTVLLPVDVSRCGATRLQASATARIGSIPACARFASDTEEQGPPVLLNVEADRSGALVVEPAGPSTRGNEAAFSGAAGRRFGAGGRRPRPVRAGTRACVRSVAC